MSRGVARMIAGKATTPTSVATAAIRTSPAAIAVNVVLRNVENIVTSSIVGVFFDDDGS